MYLSYLDDIYNRQSSLELNLPDTIVVGVGGLGSYVALYLAMYGIRNLILIDNDKVEASNLNRSLFKINHIGKYKVEAVTELILERRQTKVYPIPAKAEESEELLKTVVDDYHPTDYILVDCRDRAYPLPNFLPPALVKAGYDIDSITLHWHPDFKKIWGERNGDYSNTSHLATPAIAGAYLAYRIVFERIPSQERIETIRLWQISKED